MINDEEIALKLPGRYIQKWLIQTLSEELATDAIRDTERLTITINSILSNPRNWIVSEIKKENYEVVKIGLKPLDISPYCKPSI